MIANQRTKAVNAESSMFRKIIYKESLQAMYKILKKDQFHEQSIHSGKLKQRHSGIIRVFARLQLKKWIGIFCR